MPIRETKRDELNALCAKMWTHFSILFVRNAKRQKVPSFCCHDAFYRTRQISKRVESFGIDQING